MLSEGNRYLEQQKFRKKGENKIKHSDSLVSFRFCESCHWKCFPFLFQAKICGPALGSLWNFMASVLWV